MRGTIRALLVIPLIALLLMAGCGDEQTKVNNTYVSATDKAVQEFQTEFQQLQTAFTPVSTPEQDLKTLKRLRETVAEVSVQLMAIRPPAKIASLHARLIDQVKQYDGVIRTAETGFDSDDPRRIIAARSRFSTTLAAVATRITSTINTINKQLQ